MDKELLEALIKKCPDDADLATFLSDAFNKIESVEQRKQKLNKEIDVEKARHKKALERLMAKLKAIQQECPHKYKYHPDPSGNNDSFEECVFCGRQQS